MTQSTSSHGIITCIRTKDLPEALALGRSMALHSPAIKRAVLIEGELKPRALSQVQRLYDHILYMRPEHFKLGWQAKNVVHQYSPFDRSLFLDADCLVINDLNPFFELMKGKPVGFVTKGTPAQETGSTLYAGISLDYLLKHFSRSWWPQILGGGHFYFEKGDVSHQIFERAFKFWGINENVSQFGWKKGTVPDELSLQLALVEAGLEKTCTVSDYPLMAWNPFYHGDPDVIKGTLHGYDAEGKRYLVDKHLVIHFGGDHHNVAYRRERYRLALRASDNGIVRATANQMMIIGSIAYLIDRSQRLLGRVKRLLGS